MKGDKIKRAIAKIVKIVLPINSDRKNDEKLNDVVGFCNNVLFSWLNLNALFISVKSYQKELFQNRTITNYFSCYLE